MLCKWPSYVLCSAICVIASGCNDHPLKAVRYGRSSVKEVKVDINPDRAVDILFVIDNSGSMAAEQATLAANFAGFIEKLERPEVAADYRIAVTTTDTGMCSGTGPEDGNFIASSCLSRISQFETSPGFVPAVDARDVACEALCPAEFADLELEPSPIAGGADDQVRPWLESIAGRTNLPDGVGTAQAFACIGPQGINGCGFESPLRAMSRAITRAGAETENEFGFMRDDAILLVVFVTDEADCSVSPDAPANVLVPEVGTPRSEVCWNAGVRCEPGAGNMLECASENLSPLGDLVPAEDAVLTPVEEFIELLQSVENRKRERSGNAELDVMVSVIAGVPTGYPDAEVRYSNSGDAFSDEFGVDPGCSSSNGEAVPPVRLLEFADAFRIDDTPNLSSVCDEDYTTALDAVANLLIEEFQPACLETCLADDDPIEPGHQNDCVFSVAPPGGKSDPVAKCVRDPAGAWALPEDADACVYVAVDTERDEICVASGAPVEFRPLYRTGVARDPGSIVKAECSLSDNDAIDCPWI